MGHRLRVLGRLWWASVGHDVAVPFFIAPKNNNNFLEEKKMRKKSVFMSVIVLVAFMIVNTQVAGTPQPKELPFMGTPDFSAITACPVVRVVDGDTVVVKENEKNITVRLVGVNTPETVHPTKPVEHYGKEASRFTTNLLKGEKVYLAGEPLPGALDRYGRTLAYVYRAPDGLFVNAEIIRQGYGHAYPRFPFKHMGEFKQLERFARKAEKGLWAPAPPVITPKGEPRTGVTEYVYIASVNSEVFHDPNCRWAKKIKPHNLVGFKTREDAIKSGRRPCKVCKP